MIEYFILLILLITALIIANIILGDKINLPSTAFIAPFIVLTLVSLSHYKQMQLDISAKSICIIVSGISCFILGARIAYKTTKKNTEIKKSVNVQYIPGIRLIIFILFQIISIILTIRFLINTYGGNTLSSLLGLSRMAFANSGDGIVLPKFISLMNSVSFVGGIIMAIVIANNKKKINNQVLLLINWGLSIVCSLTGGSRGGALILIFSYIGSLILNMSNYNFKNKPFIKYIIIICIGLFIIYTNFQKLTIFLGQNQAANIEFSNYMFIYLGAQLKNFDVAVTSNEALKSTVFGQETFRSIVQLIAKIQQNNTWTSYKLYLPMRYWNGYGMGNVCTTFYPYFRDFGVMGVIICSAFIGWFSEKIYYKAQKANETGCINIWNIIWCFVFFSLSFSFFSNKFYEIMISTSMVKYLLIAIVLKKFYVGDWRYIKVYRRYTGIEK